MTRRGHTVSRWRTTMSTLTTTPPTTCGSWLTHHHNTLLEGTTARERESERLGQYQCKQRARSSLSKRKSLIYIYIYIPLPLSPPWAIIGAQVFFDFWLFHFFCAPNVSKWVEMTNKYWKWVKNVGKLIQIHLNLLISPFPPPPEWGRWCGNQSLAVVLDTVVKLYY